MASQRDITITKLIDQAAAHLGDMVKWPDSEGVKKEVELSLKALRKTLREDNYPDIFRYMATVQIASMLFHEVVYREIKFGNFKDAWVKLSELLE